MGFEFDMRTYTAIDKERNIVLLPRGRTGSALERFILKWHGEEIGFMGVEKKTIRINVRTDREPDQREILWVILAVEIPKGFSETQEAVLDVIKDSVIAFNNKQTDYHVKLTFSHDENIFSKKVIWEDL